MATQSATEVAAITALTQAHRAAQVREAAKIAALVAYYYRTQVDIEDPSSIERWLALVVKRILGGRDRSATTGVAFANTLRRLELPDIKDGFKYEKAAQIDESQIITSLMVTGPRAFQNKMAQIERQGEKPVMRQALITEARKETEKQIAGSVVRHVQNGGRQSVFEGVKRDPVALGYVRVTKGNPCFFCAMLASRGLVYEADSFEESNARFTGAHNAKVHDSCACSLKPAYRRDDALLEQSKEWQQMWRDHIEGKFSGGRAVLEWRRLYEGRRRARA